MKIFTALRFLVFFLLSQALVGPAFSQEENQEDEATYEETIVVTATKTGETALRETAMPIAVVSQADIDEAASVNLKDVQTQIPGANFSENAPYSQLYIRGVGTPNIFLGNDPSNAVHIDGVYLSRPGMVYGDFLDIDRIEAVRGPQGTLYGRNSVGGSINVITRNPTLEPEGEVQLGHNSLGESRLKARYGGALFSPNVLGSFSFYGVQGDGWVDNVHPLAQAEKLNNKRTKGVRGKIMFILDSGADVVVNADYYGEDDNPAQYKNLALNADGSDPFIPTTPIDDPHTTNIPFDPFSVLEHGGVSVTATVPLENDMTLKSISAWRKFSFHGDVDSDYTEVANFFSSFDEDQHQVTQEISLSQQSDRWNWVAGVYYFRENNDHVLDITIGGGFANSLNVQELISEGHAIFGQATYKVNETTSIGAGARFSAERKHMVGNSFYGDAVVGGPYRTPQDQKADWDDVTPNLVLEYRPNDDYFLFAKVSEGFKSGGFNYGGVLPAFDPEKLTAFEVGARGSWFGGSLLADLDVFMYDYEDMQVSGFISVTDTGGVVNTTNAAESESSGFELELKGRYDSGFSWEGGIAYLDATYKNYIYAIDNFDGTATTFDVSGNRLNYAPEFTWHMTLRQKMSLDSGGSLNFGARYYWQDDVFYSALNQPVMGQDAYGLLSAWLNYETANKAWMFSLVGQNLTDEVYYTSARDFTSVGVHGYISPPATGNLNVKYRF